MKLKTIEQMVGKTIRKAALNRYPDGGWGSGTLLEIEFADGDVITIDISNGGFETAIEVVSD